MMAYILRDMIYSGTFVCGLFSLFCTQSVAQRSLTLPLQTSVCVRTELTAFFFKNSVAVVFLDLISVISNTSTFLSINTSYQVNSVT